MLSFYRNFIWDSLLAHPSCFSRQCVSVPSPGSSDAHVSRTAAVINTPMTSSGINNSIYDWFKLHFQKGHCSCLCRVFIFAGQYLAITFVKYHMGDREITDHMLCQRVYYGLSRLLQSLSAHTATCGRSGTPPHIWWSHRWGRRRSIPSSPRPGSRRGPCRWISAGPGCHTPYSLLE